VKKVGPFDHCPQRPEPGKTLKYFEAQEGQLAAAADPLLQGAKLTRHDLPPAKPVVPASAGREVGAATIHDCDVLDELCIGFPASCCAC
jgi:hypothetical protein